ncbi:unnamed protein product [Colias eurytheme]|nr:unnamed protein product [Colias eurytheme]
MEPTITEDESFAERRKLFKDIWYTAMNLDKEGADTSGKPKVIKTARLPEVNQCMVGKKKKHRLKNLRTVCNKLLDFCDQQDADDLYYQQMAEAGKNVIKGKRKRKLLRSRNMFVRAQIMATAFEKIYDLNAKISRNLSPIMFSQTSLNVTSASRNNYNRNGTKKCSRIVKKEVSKNNRSSDVIYGGKLQYNVIRKVQSKKLLPMPKINIS